MLAEVGIKRYSIPMINRKDQIHAALYNAAIDAGFMLYQGLSFPIVSKFSCL